MIKHLLAATAVVALSPAQAVLSVQSNPAYAQTFDTLATSGTANSWVNDATLPGWSLFNKDGNPLATSTYLADGGTSNTGAFRSFGAAGSAERALGGVASGGAYFGSPASGAIAGYIALAFLNDTGADLAGFTIGFNGEQWRDGGSTTPAAQTMVLEYGFGATFAGVSSWSRPGGSFDWSSPVFANTASGAAVDGNAAGRVSGLGGSIATPWAAEQTLWIRWTERNDIGNDHGLAIDDLTFAVTPVPEPGIGTMLLAGLGAVGLLARRRAVASKEHA